MKEITTTEWNEMDSAEKIDAYIDHNRMYHFEGCSGVKNLEKLLRDMGYDRGGQFLGDWPIHNFLSDNPGAIQALIEFIQENPDRDMVENLGETFVVNDEEDDVDYEEDED